MPGSTRQLAAIMFTDIVGYTALMGDSETKSLEIRRKNRQIHQRIIEYHKGKWLKEMGDGTMAIFSTITDAVKCAVEIRKACKLELDIELKIGIHSGEIVYEDDDVFGDGVNIASRIQQLADGGGILISEPVFNDIRNKGDYNAKFIGESSLKNIDTPVKIYQVLDANLVTPDIKIKKSGKSKKLVIAAAVMVLLAFTALFLYNKYFHEEVIITNSIAVIPFKILGSDKEEEQLYSDGMQEGIITHLARIEGLGMVRSRTSTEQYRGTTKTIPEIASELQVTYILECSFQKIGNEIRITAQLIDSEDNHVWADEYDYDLTSGLFDIQTKISKEVANALSIRLNAEELELIEVTPTQNMEAYEIYLRGNLYKDRFLTRYDLNDYEIAEGNYNKAIELDPDFVTPLIDKSYLMTERAVRKGPIEYLDSAEILLNEAIVIDPNDNYIYQILGDVYWWKAFNGEIIYIQKIEDAYDKARALAPGDAMNNYRLGLLNNVKGAMDSGVYYFKKSIIDRPNLYWPHLSTAYSYNQIDMLEQAKVHIEAALEIAPDNLLVNREVGSQSSTIVIRFVRNHNSFHG